jgi:hypothetical protein
VTTRQMCSGRAIGASIRASSGTFERAIHVVIARSTSIRGPRLFRLERAQLARGSHAGWPLDSASIRIIS